VSSDDPGKVTGTVVTTISHPDFKNRRLLVVQPLVMEGEKAMRTSSRWIAAKPESVIRVDQSRGRGARQVLKNLTHPLFR